MTEYFDSVDTSLPFSRNRSRIINGVEAFVQSEFGAETSQINLNAWKLRFDIDVHSQEELDVIVDSVNELVRDECLFDCELVWEYIPTGMKGQKNGWHSGGRGDEFDTGLIGDSSYPVEAFRVTVPRQ